MASGGYDHPAYLARHFSSIITVAGASGTSGHRTYPNAMRIRNVAVTVKTAGTSATTGNKVDLFVGTASVGTIALNTQVQGYTGTMGDLNTLVPAGTVVACKNGTDATGVADVTMELHLDAVTGTWS
jgi:hypothetical protein